MEMRSMCNHTFCHLFTQVAKYSWRQSYVMIGLAPVIFVCQRGCGFIFVKSIVCIDLYGPYVFRLSVRSRPGIWTRSWALICTASMISVCRWGRGQVLGKAIVGIYSYGPCDSCMSMKLWAYIFVNVLVCIDLCGPYDLRLSMRSRPGIYESDRKYLFVRPLWFPCRWGCGKV